jgi:arsenite methyltransferase
MKTNELELDETKSVVRQRYATIAEGDPNGNCCGPQAGGCCTAASGPQDHAQALGYSEAQIKAAPAGANLGLGCGNPVALAALRPGQTVLDLGSGAGFDAFLAGQEVGPAGFVIGVDMTPAMITKARQNKAKGDHANVEFRLGEIEHLPVGDATVDVILSNCVINLSPDKERVFREAFRVLKPGGRLAISDIVALRPFPDSLRKDWELYTGCVAGAAQVEDLKRMLRTAGFEKIQVEPREESRMVLKEWFPGQGLENYVASATVEAIKPN